MGGLFSEAEVISVYTRAQAIEDGVLVDVSHWAGTGPDGMLGGFPVPVVFTRALFDVVDVDARPERERPACQSTRGRAHDVLFMARLAFAQAKRPDVFFRLLLTNGRQKLAQLRAVWDGDGVTIGFPEDF